MDPYIGQKLVSHKQTEMRAEAMSERLARLASIGARPLCRSALDRMAAVIQWVTPRLSKGRWYAVAAGVNFARRRKAT